ncbi:hypothetical protein PIB30_066818 [Stylosanthes scabra]|uniref:Disease resistance protein winged helix domain-containing protein n=1 Tax=Stylosanthes scabra TaxID=79078 RepID=A0ABU6TM57_9FABA|nr:hypothetical protein [Stylosanthes scabra]
MMERLKLSYDDLSEQMKPCFLYLGAFPEDEEILVRDLICMWIAEEFIKKPKIQAGRRSKKEARSPIEPEDIGEQYLKELVDRNLVQVASRRSDGQGVKTVKIHDSIRELCILVSDDNPDNNNKSNKACSLFFPDNIGWYACLLTRRDQPSTCSLFLCGDVKGWPHSFPEVCQVIVLYVKRNLSGKNNEYLNKLKSIRFLKMDNGAPHWLFNLQSLQTLHVVSNMGDENKVSVDDGLKQLRHLRRRSTVIRLLEDAKGVEDKMQNVQTLSYVHADSQIGSLLNKGYFANLRTLGLLITEEGVQLMEENLRSLDRLSKLHKLKLQLVTTRISLGRIPFPSNLTKIYLNWFIGLKYEHMSVLGGIPTLEILKLELVDCSKRTLHCGSAGSFPRLKVFIMLHVYVARVILEPGTMLELERAVFYNCPGLKFNCLPERILELGSNLHFVKFNDEEERRSKRKRMMIKMMKTTMWGRMMMTTTMKKSRRIYQ